MFYLPPFVPRPRIVQKANTVQSTKLYAEKHYWGLNLAPHESRAQVCDVKNLPPNTIQAQWRASWYLARSLAPEHVYCVGQWVTVICGEGNHLWVEP
jgi:hypothetical protein